MSTLMELAVVLVLCPAALAVWADTRYPNLRPKELRRTDRAPRASAACSRLVLRPALSASRDAHGRRRRPAVAVGIACTAITYGLTVSVWIVRTPPTGDPHRRLGVARPSPRARAAAASARVRACSLRRIALTCQRTVSGERKRPLGDLGGRPPAAISCRISSCRGVSRSRCGSFVASAIRRWVSRTSAIRCAAIRRDSADLAAQHAAQRLGQPLGGLILGQVADGARPHRRDHVGRVARLAEHDDADSLAVELEQLPGGVDAAAVGELQVHQHDVGRAGRDDLHRLAHRPGRAVDAEPLSGEQIDTSRAGTVAASSTTTMLIPSMNPLYGCFQAADSLFTDQPSRPSRARS